MGHRQSIIRVRMNAGNRGMCEFHLVAHETSCASERMMEREFYLPHHPDGLPEGVHIEFELKTPLPWGDEELPHVHIHRVLKPDRLFLCITTMIADHTTAHVMLQYWLYGTIYTWLTGKDFVPLIQEVKDFFDHLENTHGIEIIEIDFPPFV